MNSRQFYDKVVLMREAQKAYFKTRRRSDLDKSKALEREIDAEIERVHKLLNIETPKAPEQPSLFEKWGDINPNTPAVPNDNYEH